MLHPLLPSSALSKAKEKILNEKTLKIHNFQKKWGERDKGKEIDMLTLRQAPRKKRVTKGKK